jgi:hypothetical protein
MPHRPCNLATDGVEGEASSGDAIWVISTPSSSGANTPDLRAALYLFVCRNASTTEFTAVAGNGGKHVAGHNEWVA